MNGPLLTNAGLLLLRLASGFGLALLLVLHQPASGRLFFVSPGHIWLLLLLSSCSVLLVCGILTRFAAGISALIWVFAAYMELHAGQPWFALPIRDCEFAFLLASLALGGAGEFSFDYWFKKLAATGGPFGK